MVLCIVIRFLRSPYRYFSKIGVENVNSNLATAIRTVVILVIAWAIVFVKQKQKGLATISKHSLIF